MTSHFDLLGLPDCTVSCILSHLNLRDALRVSWVCKPLYDLSHQATHRRYACAKCQHPIFNPAVVFNSKAHTDSPQLPLQDGKTYSAQPEELGGAVLSPEFNSDDLYLRCALLCKLGRQEAGEVDYEVRVQSVTCGGCGVYLGLRLVQLGAHRLGRCNGEGMVLHATVLGRCWLPKKYFILTKADGSEDRERVRTRAYTCAAARSKLVKPGQCRNVLFEERAILSKQHCWDAGGGHETAWYINHFREGAVEEQNEREVELAQGDMQVADVHCTQCGDRIGWKFCSDLMGHENDNQVGRYGVVKSAFMPY